MGIGLEIARKKANERAKVIEKEYGEGTYGSTVYRKQKEAARRLPPKTPTYEEKKQARTMRIREIDAEKVKVDTEKTSALAPYITAYNDAYNNWYVKNRMHTANSDDVKARDEAQKKLKEQQEKYELMLAGLETEKAQLAAEQKKDDVANKYNINLDSFGKADFEKWADKNNFERVYEPFEGDLGVYTSKREGGFLGIGGKKLTTKEQEDDYKILATLAKEKLDKEIAEMYPVTSSIGTMALAPARGVQGMISTVEDSVNVAKGKEIDLFSPNKSLARSTRTIRETVDKEYASKWFGGAEVPVVGNVGSALYNAGMSIGDNVVNMAVGAAVGNVAAGAGLSATATKNIVSGITSGLLASDATVNAVITNKERGLSDAKALGFGIASGMVELATEKLSIDNIISNPADSLKKTILKGAVSEGTEEMSSEALNKMLDGLVNRENSEMNIAIKNYIASGYSKEEAVTKVWGDMLSDVLGAGVVGAFSGMAMSGTFNGVNVLDERSRQRETIKVLNNKAEIVDGLVAGDTLEALPKNATLEEIQRRDAEIQERIQNISPETIRLQSNATVQAFGENGQKAFEANRREEQGERDYTEGFERMYNLGLSNIPLEKATAEIKGNGFIQALDSDQRLAAYYAGQNDAKAQLEAEKAAVKYVNYFSDDAGIADTETAKKLSSEEAKPIDTLARVLGTQVVIEEDIEGYNGYIEHGKIHISLNAENKLAVVAAHEVTHRLQELSPESYRKYRDFVMSVVGVDAVESYRTALNKKDVYLSNQEIMDEIAADYTKKIISDPQSMQKFIDDALGGKLDQNGTYADNRNILQKMLDSVKEFIKKVNEKFSGRKAEQNQAAREAFGTDIETLKQAKNLLQKALRDSAEVIADKKSNVNNFEKDVRKNVDDKVRFSLKMGDDSKNDALLEIIKNNEENVIKNGNVFDTKRIAFQEGKKATQLIMDYFEEEGNVVENPEIGIVEMSKSGAKATVFHGIGSHKLQAIAAIKPVIEKGVIIDYQKNWKNRDYDTYVIAGKGNVAGRKSIVAVVVKAYPNQNVNNKFYIHEVIEIGVDLPDGAAQNATAVRKSTPDNNSLSQEKNIVNTQSMQKTENNSQKTPSVGEADPPQKRFSVKFNGIEEVVFERSFAEQVNEVLSKDTDITDGNHVFVCETPSILKQLGFPDLPMFISKGHLRDMHHQEVDGIDKYHGLSEPEINKIPYILENPAMVFKTVSEKNPDAICILSNVLDSKERPMLISIKPNGNGRYNEVRLESNFILSAYGRNNAQGYLEQLSNRSENVVYINKKRTQEMLKGARLQLPAGLSNLRSDIIIHKIDNNVNTQFMQSSKNNSQRKNSVKMDEDILKQNEQLKKAYALLRNEFNKLKRENRNLSTDKVQKVAKRILKDFDFAYDTELLTEKLTGLSQDTKQVLAGNMDMETFKSKVFDVAKDVIETGTKTDSLEYVESKAMRDYLRTTKITLSEDARENLGDEYETIRKSTFGRLRLVKEGGAPIDVVYQELSGLYPEYFSTETETNASAQLRQIQSVLDGLQSLKSDPFGGYTDEAAEWLSNLMIDQIYNEIFVSGDVGKATVSVDIKAMRNEMADNLQRTLNQERKWREREYKKLEERYEKKTRSYTEARQKAIKIKQVKLHTERLSKALTNPSERFAVPEDLKKPVAEFLSCINLENDRLGEKTREMLGDLMSTYHMIAEQEYELGMVLDPQLVHNIEDISEAVKSLEVKEKRISDLDLLTLEKLRTSIMSMEKMLRNYNQTFRDGKKEQIDVLASKACEEIKDRVKKIKRNSKIGAVKGVSDMLQFDMLNPWDYFHQMGGTFEKLFGGLREGENKQIKNLARGKEYLEEIAKKYDISQKNMKDKSIKTFELANGETVELTKAQVMSLYLLWRQNQTHEHITEGGIRPAKVTQKLIESKDGESKVKMTVSEDYSAVRANLDDIGAILDTLTDNEKKFAEGISNFFVDECAKWGNEVALELYGYKKFNTPNYFPIVSDKMYLQEDFGVSADSTIKNMGITKRRIKHANNPIIIEDIFDVYARHVSDMAKYNAYVLPLQDIQRVFNSRGLDGENNVKALIATKFGKQAVDYFSKLMVDINMGINNQYGNALSSNLISKYKQAKMGLNARVVIQQPISYIRAAALIDPKYMTQAIGKKVDIETVFKYSPIAQWKSWGFFSTDTGKDMYSLMTGKKEMTDYTMAFAGKADEMTWKRIWEAVELETMDLHPELQRGSEKFYEVCGKRFDEIIDRTQVVDSTLHRSQALRSPDGFTKMAYSFMSEPLKTYNLLRSAAIDAIYAKDAKSKTKLVRTIGVCAVSSVVLACVTGAFDTLTGDDEEEFLKNFGDNLKGDALGMLPYVKDIYSVVQGFTVERMDMQGLSDVVNAVLMLPKEQYTWKYKIANLSAKFAELGGVPVGSLKKAIYDLVLKNIFKGTDNFLVPYTVAKQMYYVDGKKQGEFLNILFDAYRTGNKKQYNKIFKDMLNEGLDAKTIENGLKSRFKKSGIKETFSVPWNKPYEIAAEESEEKFGIKDLTASQYQSYQNKVVVLEKDIIGDLKRMRNGLSEEEYQKRLKAAYEYSVETTLEEIARDRYESEKAWVNKAQVAEEKYGLEPAEFIMFHKYYNELTPPDGHDKFKTNEKKNLIIDYLNGMELTNEEWKYLYQEVAGYKK